MSGGRIRLYPVVDCARCCRRVILDEAVDARAGAWVAQRAGWRTHQNRWHCPLCLSHLDGTFPPQATKERVEETVSGMTIDDLSVLHGAVVAELRRRARPTITYVP